MSTSTRVTMVGVGRQMVAILAKPEGGVADYETKVRLVKAHYRKCLLFGRIARRRKGRGIVPTPSLC